MRRRTCIMVKKKIYLSSLDKANEFVAAMSKLESEVDVISDRYTVNGKSILGILSLDLTKALEVRLQSDGSSEITYFNNLVIPFEESI